MSKYLYKDIKSAFEYAKKNPESTIDDWFDYTSKVIIKEELELFEGVDYYKFEVELYNNEKAEFLFIKDYSSAKTEYFIDKFSGNKSYYHIYGAPGSSYNQYFSLFTNNNEFGVLSKWEDYEDFKGVKIMRHEDSNLKIDFVYWDYPLKAGVERNEIDFENIDHEKYRLKQDGAPLWNGGALSAYMTIYDKIEENLKPVSELFEIIEDEEEE
jgi:hypothetical protein